MKYTVQIWHAKTMQFMLGGLSQMPSDLNDGHSMVATILDVEAEHPEAAAERAFAQSQNLDKAGWNDGCRSTSVGDIFVVHDDQWHHVFSVAFLGYTLLQEGPVYDHGTV